MINDKFSERLVKGKAGGAEFGLLAGAIVLILFSIAISLFGILILGIPMFIGGIFALIAAIKNLNVEYEFTFTDGEIDIAKINSKSRRRELYNIPSDKIIKVAPASNPQVKNDIDIQKHKVYSFVGPAVEGEVYAIYTENDNSKSIALLDLNEDCIEHLKATHKRVFES